MKLSLIPSPTAISYLQGFTKARAKTELITDEHFSKESFSIHIENTITIRASEDSGFFYAKEAMNQIKSQCGENLPNIHIEDSPKYTYRAFMIDSCRHFFSVDKIKEMIYLCAKLRFNIFHWHLTDDQGWRIEIKKYPQLTKIGGYRRGSHFGSEQNDDVYGGFYTQEEMREVVKYAHGFGMTVIPEIELPGHSSALLASMPELVCGDKSVKIKTSAGVFNDIICAGNDNTFTVICSIFDEVCDIFTDSYLHLGGDEAPKEQWKSCEQCQQKIAAMKLTDEDALQGAFINKCSEYLKTKGRQVISWNESLRGGNLSSNIIVQQWMDKGNLCKNSPNRLVASDFFHMYVDYPYTMTPLKKCYNYNPQINENVIGIDTPVWTEYISDSEHMKYMCFPRFFAAASVAWCKNKQSYNSFREDILNLSDYLNEFHMAPEKDWDPPELSRIPGIIKHFNPILRNDVVRNMFHKNK